VASSIKTINIPAASEAQSKLVENVPPGPSEVHGETVRKPPRAISTKSDHLETVPVKEKALTNSPLPQSWVQVFQDPAVWADIRGIILDDDD